MRVSPSLIALNQILELSSQELQQAIRTEIESNPAIELLDRPSCPICGAALVGRVCQHCFNDPNQAHSGRTNTPNETSRDDTFFDSGAYSGMDEGGYSGTGVDRDEEFDPMTVVAAELPLSERLMTELLAVIPSDDANIGEYLIGCLDDRGFLSESVENVARAFNTDVERVESILAALQMIAPPGVGARDLRECLLLQVAYIKEAEIPDVKPPACIEALLDKYLTQLGEHKYGFIAQQIGCSLDEIHQARDFIKKHLNPFPAEGQTDTPTGQTHNRASGGKAGYVMPDVIIAERDGGFEVEVVESKRFYLRLNPMYSRLSEEMTKSASNVGTLYNTDEKEHVRQYVARAKFFMSNINQRRETMNKITKCLVDQQGEFLREGIRALKPLTRSQLASYIGMHESTVSRATAGKFVMLPSRRVIPFSDFFTASLSIKDVIKEIVEKESSVNRPLTDQEIVSRLEDRGIRVARRTVAKYRAQLRILPSTLR